MIFCFPYRDMIGLLVGAKVLISGVKEKKVNVLFFLFCLEFFGFRFLFASVKNLSSSRFCSF